MAERLFFGLGWRGWLSSFVVAALIVGALRLSLGAHPTFYEICDGPTVRWTGKVYAHDDGCRFVSHEEYLSAAGKKP